MYYLLIKVVCIIYRFYFNAFYNLELDLGRGKFSLSADIYTNLFDGNGFFFGSLC